MVPHQDVRACFLCGHLILQCCKKVKVRFHDATGPPPLSFANCHYAITQEVVELPQDAVRCHLSFERDRVVEVTQQFLLLAAGHVGDQSGVLHLWRHTHHAVALFFHFSSALYG